MSSPTSSFTADRNIGRLIGARYRIVAALGHGGMGAVYRAVHTEMSREVAVKILRPELSVAEEAVRRFEREAAAASKLDHHGCVRVFDFGSSDGTLFLVMELLGGVTLAQRIAQARIAPATAVRIAVELCEAIAHAHELGIVHRDLKPENVMLIGANEDVKVLDFGIARVMGEGRSITESGTVFGTPEYLSPEQALGEAADARADLYAIGVLLFEMIAGARPFRGATKGELLAAHLTLEPPRVRTVAPDAPISRELEQVIARALAKRREERWQTAEALRAALLAAPAESAHASATPLPAPLPAAIVTAPLLAPPPVDQAADPSPARPASPRTKIVIGLAATVAAAIVVLAIVLGRPHDHRVVPTTATDAPRSTPDELAAVRALLASGDARAARSRAADLARRRPDDAAALLVLGDSAFAAGEKSRGLAAYREAARLDRRAAAQDPELLANLRATYDDPDLGDAAFALAEMIGASAAPGLRAFAHDTNDPRRAKRARDALEKIRPSP